MISSPLPWSARFNQVDLTTSIFAANGSLVGVIKDCRDANLIIATMSDQNETILKARKAISELETIVAAP